MSQTTTANSIDSQEAPGASAVQTAFLGWDNYPESLSNFNPFCCNATKLRTQLNDRERLLFSQDVDVDVIENDNRVAPASIKSTTLHHTNDAEAHFVGVLPALRIISIIRKNSLSPLCISKQLLLKILQRHQVGSCFIDLLLSFRYEEESSEKGTSWWAPLKSSKQEYELCYQLKYAEPNDHKQGVKWSERQVGVYHKFGKNTRSTMILLHAGPNTEVQRRLHDALAKNQHEGFDPASPILLHAMIINSYLDNWRWYMDDYGKSCIAKENRGFTVDLDHESLTYKELQELRNIESGLLVSRTILEATLKTIENLELVGVALNRTEEVGATADSKARTPVVKDDMIEFYGPALHSLRCSRLKCENYLLSIKVLQHRVDKLVKLMSDGLDQRSQNNTGDIARSTFKLTKQSVDDNAIVKVITVITVIYLPTQLVASFFGMNLTSLPQPSNNILFADDWWLFLAVALPLTLLTLSVLVIAMLAERRKKQNEDKKRRKSA